MSSTDQGIALDIRNLTKRYGQRSVLEGIDLEIKPGEFIAIVGQSGCGKSTLLRLIAGLERPTGGEIIQNGQPLVELNRLARVMFQNPRLLPWKTVYGNVALGARMQSKEDKKAQVLKGLELVGLSAHANEWPTILSGGQQQRAALARALLSRPPLLLLDEPLGALDALTRMEMQQLILHLWQQQRFTALLVTHDVEEAVTLADRVILLRNGRISLNLPISLPHPRRRSEPEFARLIGEILSEVMKPSSSASQSVSREDEPDELYQSERALFLS